SATNAFPAPSSVIAYGALKRAAFPVALVVPDAPPVLPARSETAVVDITIFLISLLVASATYILPDASRVIQRGVLNLAEVPVLLVVPLVPAVLPAQTETVE